MSLRCYEKIDCIVCYFFENGLNPKCEQCRKGVDSYCSESLLIFRLKNPNWMERD